MKKKNWVILITCLMILVSSRLAQAILMDYKFEGEIYYSADPSPWEVDDQIHLVLRMGIPSYPTHGQDDSWDIQPILAWIGDVDYSMTISGDGVRDGYGDMWMFLTLGPDLSMVLGSTAWDSPYGYREGQYIPTALFVEIDGTRQEVAYATTRVTHIHPVPEPDTLLLLGFGLIGIVINKKRKKV